LLSGERFWPTELNSLAETGLSEPMVEALILKTFLTYGAMTGRTMVEHLGLPFALIDPELSKLRTFKFIVHQGTSAFNDYRYGLTEDGRRQAQEHLRECAYVGTAPVPLMDYVISVEAQAIAEETIRRPELHDVFHDISVDGQLLDLLGPAVNSASGLFLYGAPGNGKTTLAMRLTDCFGQAMWIPRALVVGQEIIKVFDPAYHHPVKQNARSESAAFDQRWVRIRRPTVIVGGELTMDSLEVRHVSPNVSEAPLQVKSNCGCLLIDDFGRQRVAPAELLNRWIIPLENRHDFLSLGSGRKIQVPFEQLIIFSTNIDPAELVDEAFLRRIRYKIEVNDPDEAEFHHLFELNADKMGYRYSAEAVEYLLEHYYRPKRRQLRRCHPRDLMQQVRNHCLYHEMPFEL
jgi:predicted ATPase with chaperone activity